MILLLHVQLLGASEHKRVWRDRVRRWTTDPVVMRSSPDTGHIRCALLANQPK